MGMVGFTHPTLLCHLAILYAITYIFPMKHTTSTDLRKNLSAMMDRVNDDHEPVIVTRAKGKPVVMISLEDYQAMDETAYLLATPANRAALMAAISESDPSRMVEVSMDHLRAMERE